MTRESIQDWADELRRYLPLSRPQAKVLALWSIGVVLAGRCGQSSVSYLLAQLLDCHPETVRQRLREFCYEAAAKQGAKRRSVEVSTCFAGLLGWVVALWQDRRLALALDATSLKQDFVVLSVSVMVCGTGIPVAWHVLPEGQPEAWEPHWLALLDRIGNAVPPEYFVLVLADRGLYAPWLFHAIRAKGWHPFLRINAGGFFQAEGEAYRPLASRAAQVGTSYCARGRAFKDHPVSCTLLAHWEEGYEEPWRVLTDLSPSDAQVSWYGLRGWIEQGFKDLKRGGWQWHLTRMEHPERVARFWLVLAVSSLWAVSIGGAADEPAAPAPPFPDPKPEPAAPDAAVPPRPAPRPRLSTFRRGCLRVIGTLLKDRSPKRGPLPPLRPTPWPPPFAAHARSPA